jgi:hypothetical protein
MRTSYGILVRKPEGKSPHKKNRCIWEGNFKMDIKEMECEDVDWIHLT